MRRLTSMFQAPGAHAPPVPLADLSGRDAIREMTLANGMKIIVWPQRDIPNVALYNWVRAGSRNEAPGRTGLAHFFEHMMFNGTRRRRPGEFDRLMEAQGGSNNAYTSDDVTVYQDWFPRAALALVLQLEADRIAHLAFVPEVIESERGVVASERALRVDDSNAGLLSERVQAAAFEVHPYRFPILGWPQDIRAWRLPDLQAFFSACYAPGNQTMVLTGDVDSAEVFALARRHLGPIAARALPPPIRAAEPVQAAERRVVIRRHALTPLLQYAYKAPAADDASGPAVNLLLAALVEGDGSRLHRRLVERERLAIDVSGRWHEGFDPALLWLYLTLPQGADPRHVQAVLDAELDQVAAQGITAAELRRAQNLWAAAFWKQVATIDGKAHLLGEYEVFHGSWRALFAAPARYESVTPGEVRAAAGAILDRRRRTAGLLLRARAAAPC